MKLDPIIPSKVLYIKLGSKGRWEHECIYETNKLKIGYRETPHDSCINGKWEEVIAINISKALGTLIPFELELNSII